MTRKKWQTGIIFVMVLLLSAFLGISGCGGDKAEEDMSGTLRISWPEEFRAIDPHLHDNQRIFWAILGQNLFETLVKRDSSGNFLPSLALEWEAVEPTVWEFKLREDVKFHNGEPFNADVVKYTFERMVRKNAPCLFLFDSIERVEVVDEYTVRIITKEPYGALLSSLSMAEMVPPVAGETEEFSTRPIGTGPFMFESWNKDEKFVMVANPDYWGGAPKLDRVEFYPILENATRVAGIKTGKLDIIHLVPLEEIDAVAALPHADVDVVPGNDTICLVFDHDKVFGDLKVRQAIAYAIDTDEIERYILGKAGMAAKSFISPTVFGFSDVSQILAGYDLDKAKALLAEAGYTGGFKTDIVAPQGFYTKDREVLEYLKAQFAKIGIDMEIRLLDPAAAWPILDGEDFELFFAGWAAMNMDAHLGLYRNYYSGNTREGFANDVVDECLNRGMKATDLTERKTAYAGAQKELAEQLLRIPLYHPNLVYGISDRVKGFEPRGDEVYDLKNVSVE